MVKGVRVISVTGPSGTCNNVITMARGAPIAGSSPVNGIRDWGVHVALDKITGLGPPPPPKTAKPKPAPEPTPPEAA
jgi:hypothetical protein